MLDMNMIWMKIKEKFKCSESKKHWYIAAIVGLLLWCWIF